MYHDTCCLYDNKELNVFWYFLDFFLVYDIVNN